MIWNYRVVSGRYAYGIHEVYYEDGKVALHTDNPIHPSGETLEELKADYKRMAEAFDKPVLDYDKIGLIR